MIEIIALHSCGKCKTALKLAEKHKLAYTIIYDTMNKYEYYPMIFVDGKEVLYKDFLKKIRSGEIK